MLDGGCLLEAVQGGFELTRAIRPSQPDQTRASAEVKPSLLVLGVFRQALFEVGDRLIQEIPGFFDSA